MAPLRASVTLHPDFTAGPVDRRMFGSFVEHLGRTVYTGIHEPGQPAADAEGFRADVADLTRELGVSVVRYPGGNFVSNYVRETASVRARIASRSSTSPGARPSPTRSAPTSSCSGPSAPASSR